MTDYSALVAFWGTLPAAGDVAGIAANLKTVNAHTIAGPLVDVPVAKVAGYLMRKGKLLPLQGYAQQPPQGAGPLAVGGARMLMAICGNQSVVGEFEMSDPTVAAEVEAMLAAMVADSVTGLVADDQAAILAMAAGQALTWHSAPVSEGGAGLPGDRVNGWDLFNAGLIDAAAADAVESL